MQPSPLVSRVHTQRKEESERKKKRKRRGERREEDRKGWKFQRRHSRIFLGRRRLPMQIFVFHLSPAFALSPSLSLSLSLSFSLASYSCRHFFLLSPASSLVYPSLRSALFDSRSPPRGRVQRRITFMPDL